MRRFAGPRKTGPSARRVLRGFTLVELIVVVVILSMLASLAVPRFAGAVARRRVESAAHRIEDDLGWVQQRARSASRSKAVRFDAAALRYTVPGMADMDRPGSDYTVHLDRLPYELEVLRVNLGGDAELVFNGFGLPDSGGVIVLGCGRDALAVGVDSRTGVTRRFETQVDPGSFDPDHVRILDPDDVVLIDPNDGQVVPVSEMLP